MAEANQAVKEFPRLGWIGTGVMGASMAGRLLSAGYSVSVYNRTSSKAESLIRQGAQWRESPAAVAEVSDIVFTMVGHPHDVREVLWGPSGILEGWRFSCSKEQCNKGGQREEERKGFRPVYIDCTTSSPELARGIAQQLAEEGFDSLDAPVSGGDIGAKNGMLSIMVGGKRTVFEAMVPLFSHLGSNVVWEGEAGSGQNTKMVNQILIAGNMIGVCEAILYAQRNGLDSESVLKAVSSGAAGSWSLSNMGPRIIAGNFEPGFYIEHFIKDLGIALEEAERMNLTLPGLALARRLYTMAAEQGLSKKGTQALIKVLEEMNKQGSNKEESNDLMIE